jgi:hypothetical protein
MAAVGILYRLTIGPRFGQPEWIPCLIGVLITGIVGLVGMWYIGLTPDDRKVVISRLPARFRPAAS